MIDDTVVERISAGAPGSLIHHNHTAKPNRPRFLRGQGWLCLAAVVEQRVAVGAVPLMLRLVRRGANRGKLRSARFLLRLLGQRLGQVRRPARRLVHARLADPGRGRRRPHRDRPRAPRPRALRGAEAAPAAPPRAAAQVRRAADARRRIEALPVHRSAQILYGKLEVVRYRTCLVAARFLKGRVVRAVWVELERPDRRDKPAEERLLICTDPDLPATEVITELREEVGGGAAVRGHQARLGAEGCLAAVAPGADALGHHPGGGLCAHPDAGLRRSGAPARPGRSRALAAARHPHRRA